jgi:hypothetical protein
MLLFQRAKIPIVGDFTMKDKTRKHCFEYPVFLTNQAMNELVCQQFAFSKRVIANKKSKKLILDSEHRTIHFNDSDVRIYLSILRRAGNLPYFITNQHEIAHDLNLSIQTKGNSFASSTISKASRRLAQAGYLFVVHTAANSRYYPLVRKADGVEYSGRKSFDELVQDTDKINIFKTQDRWLIENTEEKSKREKELLKWEEKVKHFERYKKNEKGSLSDSFWNTIEGEIGDEDEDGDDFLPAEWDKFHD